MNLLHAVMKLLTLIVILFVAGCGGDTSSIPGGDTLVNFINTVHDDEESRDGVYFWLNNTDRCYCDLTQIEGGFELAPCWALPNSDWPEYADGFCDALNGRHTVYVKNSVVHVLMGWHPDEL